MPSGHTTTAIGVFCLFAWLTVSSSRKFLFATIACLAAISRIALYQHFPADVLLGVFLGLTTIAPSLYLQRFIRKRFPFVADKPFIKRR
jgi:membrane-associated phospholipid phosphatase